MASNHPKWNMGYNNSIDSATLSNKCLELIEAHYLFDIPFNKLKIVIHPQSKIHSNFECISFGIINDQCGINILEGFIFLTLCILNSLLFLIKMGKLKTY